MKDVSTNEGRTVLFVSHNLQAISTICERGIVIEKGRVYRDGTMEAAINGYFNLSRNFALDDTVAIKDRMNRSNGKMKMMFISVTSMKNGKKNEMWTYLNDEEIQLSIECKANEKCEGLIFYMAFKGLLSESIITNIKTLITKETIAKEQKINFTVCIPPGAIRPGQYDLYFLIGDRNEKIWYDVIDVNVNLPALIIMPTSTDPHDNVGFFKIPFSIQMENSSNP